MLRINNQHQIIFSASISYDQSITLLPVTSPALPNASKVDPRPFNHDHPVWVIANFIAMLVIIAASIFGGLKIRRTAWDLADEIHFKISLRNAIGWGYQANSVGILNLYQKWYSEHSDDLHEEPGNGMLALDYPPLRLLIMAKWAAYAEAFVKTADEKQIIEEHRRAKKPLILTNLDRARLKIRAEQRGERPFWRNDYEFNRPMLELNTACEFAGAIAMFLLVHYWTRICTGAPAQQWIQPLKGAWPALFSALLLWFSPALIFNAHSYPQWDAWIVAPFLLAIYFGMLDLWLISGILIGTVAMGKGQLLIVVPGLIVWQVCMLRFDSIIRLGVGIILAIGVVASPWLTSTPLASTWLITVAIGLLWLLPLFFLRDWSAQYIVAGITLSFIAAGLILWPWHSKPHPPMLSLGIIALIALAIAARFLPRWWIPTWSAAGIAAALFACYPIFHTSMAWYEIGIKFPTEHWQRLYWCQAFNLGAILNQSFGWQYNSMLDLGDYLPILHNHFFDFVDRDLAFVFRDKSWINYPWRIIPMRYLMHAAYLTSLLLSGIGMAIHTRRKDRQFFFALVAPWVLMFALLPQMQNRYLVWASAFAAATAFSLDGLMLFVLINVISYLNTLIDMLFRAQNTASAEKWQPLIVPLFPDLGWAVLLIAAVYLYLALRRDRRRVVQPIKQIVPLASPPAERPTADEAVLFKDLEILPA